MRFAAQVSLDELRSDCVPAPIPYAVITPQGRHPAATAFCRLQN